MRKVKPEEYITVVPLVVYYYIVFYRLPLSIELQSKYLPPPAWHFDHWPITILVSICFAYWLMTIFLSAQNLRILKFILYPIVAAWVIFIMWKYLCITAFLFGIPVILLCAKGFFQLIKSPSSL